MVDVLSQVTPGLMKEAWEEGVDISKTMCYVKCGRKPMLAQIRKIKSRPVWRYLYQFDTLVFRQGVLHRVYEQDGSKYHQLILPIEFRGQAMELLHNQQVHQAVEHMLQFVCERFYWTLCSKMSQTGLKIVSGVKLPRFHMLIQIQHRDQL